jgi:DNA-binding SARP family transcriptional activator
MGPIQINSGDQRVELVSAKAQALLAYLAVTARPHSRQSLAGLLWGELPEADARRNLRGVLMKLRPFAAPNLIVSHQTIGFNRESAYWLDVEQFRNLQPGRLTSRDEALVWEEVAALYRGEFLQDLFVRQAPAFEAWVMQQREGLRRQGVAVFRELALFYEAQGMDEAGIAAARRLLRLDPANEQGVRLLMRFLARNGRRSEAISVFDNCRCVLAELGTEPSPETAVLLHQIRSNSLPASPPPPQPAGPPSASAPQPPPFLAGPPITHAAGFFGRAREIKRITNLLRYLPMQNAAIIGPRRSGKTSLLHHLQHQRPQQGAFNWIFVDFQDRRMGDRAYLLHYLLEKMALPAPDSCDLETFLEIVSDELTTPTVILMDEFEVALQRYAELDDPFWDSLRSLATNQVGGRLAFVLAAADSPGELAQQSGLGSPFFNIFGYVARLGPLTEPEARALIASSPRPFSPEDVDWIVAESGRWPILLQILCRERLLSLEEGTPEADWRSEARQQIVPFLYLKEGGA